MRGIVLLTGLAVLGIAPSLSAQVVVYGGPAVVPYTSYYAPVVVAPRRAVAYYAPAAVAYPAPVPVSAYYAPAPVTSYYAPTPVTSYYAPAPAVQATAYYAPVTAYYPAAPVVAYRPTVVAQPAYVIGRGVIGQTKVYIPGQPVRNSVRFVTP